MTETVSVTLPQNTWTVVAPGAHSVTVYLDKPGFARFAVASAAPDTDDEGVLFSQAEKMSVSGLSGGNRVYVRPVDGGNALRVLTDAEAASANAQVVPDFKTANALMEAYSNFSEVNWAGGDFVSITRTANGQRIMALSCSPLTPGESRVVLDLSAKIPCALDVEASLIRNRQQFATLTLFSDGDDNSGAPVVTPLDITSIHQSTADYGQAYTGTAGTILTVTLNTALPRPGLPGGVFIGDWCHVVGLVDTRLNYQNLCVRWISDDRKTVTFGFSDEAALPSLAIPAVNPALGSAKLHVYQDFNGADSAAGYHFTGTSATSAALIGIFGGDAGSDKRITGTLLGDHRVTIGSTAPASVVSGNAGGFERKATSRFRIEARPGEVAFLDKGVDNVGALWSARTGFSAVKPGTEDKLKPRFRIYQPPGMSRPVAKIASASKTGTTTATIVTKAPHGLVTGNYVTIKGVRDQTNFAAISTPVAVTVVNATTFTCTLGSAVTATSQGGSVHLIHGGADQPGIIGQYAQSVSYTLSTDTLFVTGNTNWSGLAVGDYVDLYGVVDTSGNDLGLDGAWEVGDASPTTLRLRPIIGLMGRVSPAPGANIGSTNCGGSVILRTTARIHDLMFETWDEGKTMILGQGTSRADLSVPVNVVNIAPVQGPAPRDSSYVANPVLVGLTARNANPSVVSASGDVIDAIATMHGVPIVRPYALPEADWRYTGSITVTTDVAAKAAAGTAVKNYLNAVQLQNTGAAATVFTIKDGATPIWSCSLPAAMAAPVAVEFPTPLAGTANTALNFACATATTVMANAQGHIAP